MFSQTCNKVKSIEIDKREDDHDDITTTITRSRKNGHIKVNINQVDKKSPKKIPSVNDSKNILTGIEFTFKALEYEKGN